MQRRAFLQSLAATAVTLSAQGLDPLPGTAPLDFTGELDVSLMDGAHAFVERKIGQSLSARPRRWNRDFTSAAAYEKSVDPNRARFRKITGAVDPRLPPSLERYGSDGNPALVSETPLFTVWQVRWSVFDGVTAEGLLLEPRLAPQACAVALPDADQTPEQISGLAPGLPPECCFARRLAENRFLVLVPVLIDRTARWSGNPEIARANLPHREWIYRQAFHMGRHIVGYEVQKTLAAADWFQSRQPALPAAVAGYGEGALVAFYSAALDPRLRAALVSGYFDSRQQVWSEPIFRNIWGLLDEFGDAEIASLIAPRGLVVEHAEAPRFQDSKGETRTPAWESVQGEFSRIATILPAGFQTRHLAAGPDVKTVGPMSPEALRRFASLLGLKAPMSLSATPLVDRRKAFDPAVRQRTQVLQLEAHVQNLVRVSEQTRERFFFLAVMPQLADNKWSTSLRHPTHEPRPFIEAGARYRRYLWKEVLGRFEEPYLPPNPRTRKIYDTAGWAGYDVVLYVWPELIAWGVLLVPKNLRSGERRPVVVCQHGRRGLPKDVIEGDVPAYNNFAARLADRGFIVFAPHNLYRGEDRYRWLSRKANSVKASMFSVIIAQHDQITRWLATLPFVDPARIAFYGLSYGGETAVRVPPLLERYCLSICSGDFNNWTRKVAATDQPFSFMYTIEWEMPYFDMGNTFDYAELAALMIPRPFMVERGHNDRVGRDQWVSYEYARVRWLYTQLGLADKAEIEFFNGGHTINAQATFAFLHKHLDWPEPSASSPGQ